MNEEVKKAMIESMKGKTVSNLYEVTDESPSYWVMEFEGGGETCFKFMSEIIRGE